MGVGRRKLAVAERVSVGEIHMRHVPFLVVSDGPEAFAALLSGYRGAIGYKFFWPAEGSHGIPMKR
jgi:hypothetical protein